MLSQDETPLVTSQWVLAEFLGGLPMRFIDTAGAYGFTIRSNTASTSPVFDPRTPVQFRRHASAC